MGDNLNCHHPIWNPWGYTRHDKEADVLINLTAELGLSLMIPSGIITFPNADTAIDLVSGNERAINNMLKCRIVNNNDHGSDHLSIETMLISDTMEDPVTEPSFNYAKANCNEFKNQLKIHIPSMIPSEIYKCQANINVHVKELVDAIQLAMKESIPLRKPSPHSKRW